MSRQRLLGTTGRPGGADAENRLDERGGEKEVRVTV